MYGRGPREQSGRLQDRGTLRPPCLGEAPERGWTRRHPTPLPGSWHAVHVFIRRWGGPSPALASCLAGLLVEPRVLTPLWHHQGNTMFHCCDNHLNSALKLEYLTEEDSLTFWQFLKDRFDQQRSVVLPQARSDWLNLRFQDFKSVTAYNSALHRIVSLLRMCGQKVTDAEIGRAHV